MSNDSTNNKSYKIVKELCRLYTKNDPPTKIGKEVKAWLVDDYHTTEKQSALWSLWNTLDITVNKHDRKKAWKSVCEKTGIQTGNSLSLTRRRFLQAASITIPVIVAGGGLYFLRSSQATAPVIAYEQQVNIYRIQTEEETKTIHFANGTEVVLNTYSTLEYENEQQVQLINGEAYFNVRQNENEKFIVHAGPFTATVLGTCFNIRNYTDEEESFIALYSGKLEVGTGDTTISMSPGDECVMNHISKTWDLRKTNRSSPAWNRNYINYNDKTLQEIFQDLELRYPVKINITNKKILNELITLKVEKDTSITEVIFLMSQISGKFTYTIHNDSINIY